jgi:hypothetical protein
VQNDYLKLLASPAIQGYIHARENDDERKLVLQLKSIQGLPTRLIAQQISGRRKAKHKLPTYYATDGIVFPPTVNLEQSSSEQTATFKCELLNITQCGSEKLVDLTGGFGVDAYFFSRRFADVIYIEPDTELSLIAAHNHEVLNASNIEHLQKSAEEFLSRFDGRVNVVFIDPSRRGYGDQKVHSFRDCQPNLSAIQSRIFEITDCLLVKASPLLDIKAAIADLTFVKVVAIVSVENECKEVLYFCQKDFSGETRLEAIDIAGDERQLMSFTFSEERLAESDYSLPDSYLYEPNVAVLKSGAFKLVGTRFELKKLEVNTHLYTSGELRMDFPGRIFSIRGELNSNNASNFFPDKQANFIVRNYPAKPAELARRLKLIEGGMEYVVATSSMGRKMLLAARRVK